MREALRNHQRLEHANNHRNSNQICEHVNTPVAEIIGDEQQHCTESTVSFELSIVVRS